MGEANFLQALMGREYWKTFENTFVKATLLASESSVKWGHLATQQTQFSLPILWGHLAHFEPNSTNTIFSTNPMGSSSPP